MNLKKRITLLIILIILGVNIYGFENKRELPRPDFNNTFYMTFYIPIGNCDYFFNELDLIKYYFKNKIYNRIGVSEFILLNTEWNNPENNVKMDLEPIYYKIREHLSISKDLGIGLHIGLIFGFVRSVGVYNEAKKDDIRNCQWYNDGKLASDDQLKDIDNAMNTYIWLTLSRYALELRNRLKNVCFSIGPFLNEIENEYPQTFITASGDGEVELNFNRKGSEPKDFPIVDYSPFAILEFRDWILHKGLYDDENGLYKGEGYKYGGKHYCSVQGLNQFNLEFDTDFKTWDLKYYNWSIEGYENTKIPWNSISDKGKLLPDKASLMCIEGGFDAPRKYNPGSSLWRLWERFRQEMVRNYTKDIARWIYESGFQSGKWYTHQIPADYLWGNSPEQGTFEHRLLSSASPLWTADTYPFGKIGVTCFDIKFPDGYKRTTENLLPYMKFTGKDWAVLEFDPFTIPAQFNLQQESDIDLMYQKYKQTYDSGVHLMAIFKWEDNTGEHQTKGTKKIDALKHLWNDLKNLPWNEHNFYVYYPPSVKNLLISEENQRLKLSWKNNIWYDLNYTWNQLPYFKIFEVYKIDKKDVEYKIAETSNKYIYVKKPDEACSYYVKAVFYNEKKSKNTEIIHYYKDEERCPYFPEKVKYINIDSKNRKVSGYIRIIAENDEHWNIKNRIECLSLQKLEGKGSDLIEFNIDFSNIEYNEKIFFKIDLIDETNNYIDSLYFYFYDNSNNKKTEPDELEELIE